MTTGPPFSLRLKMNNSEANYKNGYIKLYRSLLDWEWYDDANTMRLFVHLLLSANHETKEWHGIKIEAGQLIIGRLKLAEKLKLSERKIRTALKHLKTTKEVTIETTKSYSLITLNNWHLYNQENDQENDQQMTTNKNTTNTIYKSINSSSVQKNNEPPQPTKKVFKKPTIKEIKKYISEKNLRVDGEKFLAYYEANGWMVGRNKMKSWKSSLIYWNKTEKKSDDSDFLARVDAAFNN